MNEEMSPVRRLSLRGVFAGVVTVYALMMLFMLMLGGFKLWTFDLREVPLILSRFWLWTLLFWVMSSFIGAYIAGYVAGSERALDGVIQGIVTWSSVVVIAATAFGILSEAFASGYLVPINSGAMSWVMFVFNFLALLSSLWGGWRGSRRLSPRSAWSIRVSTVAG